MSNGLRKSFVTAKKVTPAKIDKWGREVEPEKTSFHTVMILTPKNDE